MSNSIRASVVIPTYNSSKKVIKALDVIEKININNDIEVILVDDDSQDFLSLSKLPDRYSFTKVIKSDRKHNAAYTRNVGIELSKGDYIFLLDSDDYFDESYLERRIELHGSLDFIYGEFWVNNSGHKSLRNCGDFSGKSPEEFLFDDIMGDFRTSTISFTKRIKRQVNFDVKQHKHQDWGLLFRLYRGNILVSFDPEPGVIIDEDISDRMSAKLNVEASSYFYNTYLLNVSERYSNRFLRFLIGNCFLIGGFNEFKHFMDLYKPERSDLKMFLIYFLYKCKVINHFTYSILFNGR